MLCSFVGGQASVSDMRRGRPITAPKVAWVGPQFHTLRSQNSQQCICTVIWLQLFKVIEPVITRWITKRQISLQYIYDIIQNCAAYTILWLLSCDAWRVHHLVTGTVAHFNSIKFVNVRCSHLPIILKTLQIERHCTSNVILELNRIIYVMLHFMKILSDNIPLKIFAQSTYSHEVCVVHKNHEHFTTLSLQ